jgi:hypothetical protein
VKQYVRYYAGLVALYIAVAHGSDLGALFSSGASGFATATKSLQGRG